MKLITFMDTIHSTNAIYTLQNPVSMNVRQQRDILDHTYRLLTDFNYGISPKVLELCYQITAYPDNVKCLREVLLRGGRRVKKVQNFYWKRVSNMVSMVEFLISFLRNIHRKLKTIPVWRTSWVLPAFLRSLSY